ncbi:hypothetical protein CRUP_025092, partial [Coryphaenoides rupestris]
MRKVLKKTRQKEHLHDIRTTRTFRGAVSEDEVTSEASDMAVDRERYVDDLHRALVEGEDRRRGGGGGGGGGAAAASGGGGRKTKKENYSFHLTPDHSRLSYEKTCKGIL